MNKKPLQLKDYLLISFICVLFGVFYLFAVYAGGMFTGVLAPFGLGILGYEPFYGIWFMAPVFTLYIIRKPGHRDSHGNHRGSDRSAPGKHVRRDCLG